MSGTVLKESFLNPKDYPEELKGLVEDFNKKLVNSMGIITGLAKEYHTIWLVNRKTLALELYRSTGEHTVSGLLGLAARFRDYPSFIKAYVTTYVADHPEDVENASRIEVVEEKIRNGELYTIEYLRIDEEGRISYHQMAFALAGDPDGAEKFILAFKDVDKIVRRHMADKQYLYEQLGIVNALSRDYYNVFKVDLKTGNVVILKLDGYVTKGMEGPGDKVYPYDVLCNQYITDRVYSEDIPAVTKAMSLETVRRKMKETNEYVSSYRVHDHGEIHYYQFTYIPISPLDKSLGILAGFKNVDDVVAGAKEREQLIALAETDIMTGILNRGSGEKKVANALDEGTSGMFCILDIDRFKHINDTYGHDVGDKVIRGIADVLKDEFRKRDVIFRLGGDEYAIFAPNVNEETKGRKLLKRVLDAIEKLVIPELEGMKPTVSVGALIIPHGVLTNFDEAYRKADECVYSSKKNPDINTTMCTVLGGKPEK